MTHQRTFQSLFTFFFWSALFSVAYTQSPLYTSNQNTYFLHGFACADRGYLSKDWLANTRDVTPLFSALVCATLRWLRFEGFFYLFYALILGIYFTILFKLAQQEADLQPRSRKLAFLALFFLVHSAGWRFGISRTLGEAWMYAFEGGLANQRLLGSVFQPSVFGVFLLAGVWLASQQKIGLAIYALALAVWFHPTYLLPAILLFLGMLASILSERFQPQGKLFTPEPISSLMRKSLLFLVLIAPPALYALSFNFSPELSPELTEQAQRILFAVRIPHHADPTVWFNASSLFQIALMVSALSLTRQKALRWFLGIPLLFSTLLTLIVVLTRNPSLALLFPWRVTTVLVPLSVTILSSRLVGFLPQERENPNHPLLVWVIPSLSTSLIALTLLVGWVRLSLDFQRQRNQPERPLMEFVSKHKQPQDIYLIPLKMQDFRLVSEAAIFVDFKSTPYHPIEVLEWYRRYQIADDFYQSPTCEKIESFRKDGVNHLVLPIELSPSLNCPSLETLYRDETYQLMRIFP